MASSTLASLGTDDRVVVMSRRAERVAAAHGPRWVEAVAANTLACALLAQDPEAAWTAMERSRVVAEELVEELPRLLLRFFVNGADCCLGLGRYEEAVDLAQQGLVPAAARGLVPAAGAALTASLVEGMLALGSLRAARTALARFTATGTHGADEPFLSVLGGLVDVAEGSPERARACEQQVRSTLSEGDASSDLTAVLELLAVTSRAPAGPGDREALGCARRAVAANPLRAWPVLAAVAAELVRQPDSVRGREDRAAFEDLVARVPVSHDSVTGRWRLLVETELQPTLEGWTRVATVLRSGEGPVATTALVHLRLAEAAGEAGDPALRATALARAADLVERHHLAGLADRHHRLLAAAGQSAPDPLGLSSREVEVLRLLARGQSYKGVAEMLFISPRTVEAHVSRLLTKLSVSSRGEAVALAMRRGLLSAADFS